VALTCILSVELPGIETGIEISLTSVNRAKECTKAPETMRNGILRPADRRDVLMASTLTSSLGPARQRRLSAAGQSNDASVAR
jgi:hypothetical protein